MSFWESASVRERSEEQRESNIRSLSFVVLCNWLKKNTSLFKNNLNYRLYVFVLHWQVEISSPNAESDATTFCSPSSILSTNMCSKIATTAASVTAALSTSAPPVPALEAATTAATVSVELAAAGAAAGSSSATAVNVQLIAPSGSGKCSRPF